MNISKAALTDIIDVLSNTNAVNYSSLARRIRDEYDANISESNLRKSLKFTHLALLHNQNLPVDPHLKLVKQNLDKNGEILNQTFAARSDKPIDTDGLEIYKITENPNGAPWIKWKAKSGDDDFNFNDEYLERLKETLTGSIEPFVFELDQSRKNILKVIISDRHIGAHVSDDSMYNNTYNKHVYNDRMEAVKIKILQFQDVYGSFDEVVFYDLGDLLDGYDNKTTRGGHHLPQNMNNQEQFETFLETEKRFFDDLIPLLRANKISYNVISNDNHSGDFGYMAFRAFETYLNIKYPQVKTNVTTKFLNHHTVGNETVVFTHGKDKKDRKFGLPKELNEKSESYIREYLDSKNITGKVTVIKGDLHQYNRNKGRVFDYINYPSLFGSSEWIHNNYGNTKGGFVLNVNGADFEQWFD